MGNVNPGMMSSNKDYWETPQATFDKWDRIFHFTLDVCSTDENCKCEKHYTEENSCLDKDWSGETCWMNPPYGKDIHKFVRKAAEESLKGVTTVALLPARMDTLWFHTWVYPYARKIYLIPGRLKFELNGIPGGTAPFPSMIVVFGKKDIPEKKQGLVRKAIGAMVAGFSIKKGTKMQINSSTIATFGGGLAVGVVIGIFAEVAFEKWQDRKAAQSMTVNPIEEEASDIAEKDEAREDKDSEETDWHADSLAPMPGIEPGEPNKYSKQYKVYKREESDIPVFDSDKSEKKDELDRSPQIIITADEYMNGKGSYEKIECTYAEDDQGRWMLTNDDGNVEMDVRDTIGESALGYFKHEPEMDDNESVVYVRNDLLGADYCVMKYPYME